MGILVGVAINGPVAGYHKSYPTDTLLHITGHKWT